jgi:hypothetical protein
MNHNMLWLVSLADAHFCQSYRLHYYLNRSHGVSQIVTADGVAMEREGSCKSLVINGCASCFPTVAVVYDRRKGRVGITATALGGSPCSGL